FRTTGGCTSRSGTGRAVSRAERRRNFPSYKHARRSLLKHRRIARRRDTLPEVEVLHLPAFRVSEWICQVAVGDEVAVQIGPVAGNAVDRGVHRIGQLRESVDSRSDRESTHLALSAVFPLPARSYDTPRRGETSFQFGTS